MTGSVKHPFFIPQCSHARLLVNKRALYLLSMGAAVSHPDMQRFAYADPRGYAYYMQFSRYILGNSTDYKRLQTFYVSQGHEFEYMFIVARCGRCELCRHSRQLDYINRAALETMSYPNCPAYFFTLTYRNSSLPSNRRDRRFRLPLARPGELCHVDIQRFLKRLRIAWTRSGLDHDMRYLVCGEYGSKSGRPHYHLIMWNNPYSASEFKPWLDKQLASDVFKAWSYSDPQAFDYGEAGDGAAAYVTKYVTKQAVYKLTHSNIPGFRQPYIRMSIGHGGLGSRYIRSHQDYYSVNPAVQTFDYLDFSGRFHRIPISGTLKTYLFPSVSRQIPVKVKQTYREFCSVLEQLYFTGKVDRDYCQMMSERMRPYGYPNHLYIDVDPSPSRCWLVNVFIANRLWRIHDCLARDLSDYLASPVDIDSRSYYCHSAASPSAPDLRDSLGQKYAKIRDQVADTVVRELL